METRRLKPWEFTDQACLNEGTVVFYAQDPDDLDEEDADGESETVSRQPPDYSEAKKLCAMCVHRADCAEWGIDNETHGVWGGLDPEERRLLKRRLARVRSRQSLTLVR